MFNKFIQMGNIMNEPFEHNGQHKRKTKCNIYDQALGKIELTALAPIGMKCSGDRTALGNLPGWVEIDSTLEKRDLGSISVSYGLRCLCKSLDILNCSFSFCKMVIISVSQGAKNIK